MTNPIETEEGRNSSSTDYVPHHPVFAIEKHTPLCILLRDYDGLLRRPNIARLEDRQEHRIAVPISLNWLVARVFKGQPNLLLVHLQLQFAGC